MKEHKRKLQRESYRHRHDQADEGNVSDNERQMHARIADARRLERVVYRWCPDYRTTAGPSNYK